MIVRGEHQSQYAVVPNAVANDDRLSFDARGMLIHLLTKPPQWRVSPTALAKNGGIGRDKCYRLLNALISAGYIVRRRATDEGGRVNQWEYTVFDEPVSVEQAEAMQGDLMELDPKNPDADEECASTDVSCETAENCESDPHPENQEVEAWRPENPNTEKPDLENQDAYKVKKDKKYRKNIRARGAPGKPGCDEPPPVEPPPQPALSPASGPPMVRGVRVEGDASRFETTARRLIAFKGEPYWNSYFAYSLIRQNADGSWTWEVKSNFVARKLKSDIGGRLEQWLGSGVEFVENARRAPPAPEQAETRQTSSRQGKRSDRRRKRA